MLILDVDGCGYMIQKRIKKGYKHNYSILSLRVTLVAIQLRYHICRHIYHFIYFYNLNQKKYYFYILEFLQIDCKKFKSFFLRQIAKLPIILILNCNIDTNIIIFTMQSMFQFLTKLYSLTILIKFSQSCVYYGRAKQSICPLLC